MLLSKTTTRKQIQQSVGLLGSYKRYQLILGIVMSLNWMVITLLIANGFFVFMNPVFKCGDAIVQEKQACNMLSDCTITNTFTATSFSGIVCEKQSMRSTIQSMFYVGNLLALITFAPLSDSKGRRPTSLVITLLLVLSQVIMYFGILEKIWAFIIISQLINGVFVAAMSINTYVFTAQFCTDNDKQKYIMIYWVTGSLTGALMFVFYNYMPEWNKFIIFGIGIPALVLLVFSYFFVLQTPHFILFLEKDLEKFDECIDTLAKYNNCSNQQVTKIKSLARTFYQEHWAQNVKDENSNKSQFFQSAKLLYDNKEYLSIALRLSISKIGVNAFYFALTYCFDRLGYNFGLSMLIFGINECISSLVASFILQKAPKKRILIISIFVSALFGFSYFLPFINGHSGWQSVIICLATISIMFAFVTLGLMSVECFPTQINSTSIGVIDCVSYTINVFMPFFVNLMHDSHLNPVGAISFLLLICGIGPLIGLKNVIKNPREDLSNKQHQQIKE